MIDLLVAGGGPAGLATALRARGGAGVVVVERQREPSTRPAAKG